MRSLSFVDRMVSPWVTAAQRSAGLRMFSQYASSETPERVISGVSWVFPRPWYQDELDWIAASRASQAGQDMIFTTRGTYAQAADRRRESSLPSLEYVAPSFSPTTSDSTPAYSPLVSHSSYSAASVVAQSMQAIAAAGAMARGLPVRQAFAEQPSSSSSSSASASSYRTLAGISSIAPLVSSLIPDGESGRFSIQPSALAMRAPTMVTPPSPRGDDPEAVAAAAEAAELRSEHAVQSARSERETAVARAAAETVARQEQSRAMAVTFAQERERVAEQMRATARAERERAAAAQLEPAASAPPVSAAALQAAAAEAARTEAIREEVARIERTRETSSRLRSSARQQARIDAIVAERLARLEPLAGAESSAAPSMPVASVETAAPVAAAPTEAQSQAMVQALRMAELLAHAAAIGPSAMAPSAGPRMALPSGLGGLVAGMNTVSVIERERAAAVEQAPRRQGALPFAFGFQPIYTAPATESSAVAPSQLAPSAQTSDDVAAPAPVFATPSWATPSWTRAPRALVPEAMRVDSALGSIASRTPAALGHVAWADRWLGRFAGASETALESMSSISMRAQYAPSQLFVAPSLDVPRQVSESGHLASAMAAPGLEVVAPRRQEAPSRVEASPSSTASSPAAQAPAARVEAPRPVAAPQEALRFGDDDVVPDELFAAIAASPVARPPQRPAAAISASAPPPRAAATGAAQPSASRSTAPQLTAADIVALTAPSAPVDAGLSASLAASPMAPALGHVLSLPRAAIFDPRSLGGSELAFAFLSGAVTAPMVAQFSYGSSPVGSTGSASGWEPSLAASGEAPSLWRQWSAELVRPAEMSRAAAMRGDDAEVIASSPRPAPAFLAPSVQAATPVATSGSAGAAPASASEAAAAASSVENIITLRSTLLSPASPRQQRLAASSGTVASWVNQEAADALPVAYQTLGELLSEAAPDRRWLSTLPAGLSAEGTPLAGDESEAQRSVRFDHGFPLVFWPLASTPGALSAAMAASAAQETEAARATRPTPTAAAARAPWAPSWAAAPESEILAPSAATLVEQGMPGSMDRGALSPGMLAQRALGFGATQSSQTADLSFDFVPPELVLAARVYGFGATEAAQAARLAMGGTTGLSAMAGAVDLRFISLMGPSMGAGAGAAGAGRADATSASGEPPARSPEAPSAREADASFGVAKRMPRGAFLLPSASVAAMGLSAALPEGEHAMSIAALEVLAAKMVAELGSFASPSMPAMAAGSAGAEGASPSRRAPSSTFVDISQPAVASEASEEDVLSSASASIAASRRTRFEQLYIALAESNTGRTMSPAARAARALALANRDEDATTFSSRERAALAWQIFPVVLNGEAAPTSSSDDGRESADGRGASSRSRSAPALTTVAPAADRPGAEMRPGLASLSSRAGEALSSFVTSAPASSSGAASSSSSSGGENRGWKSGRFGGGEVEIPSWFEAAARKMFEERGEIEGISLAELTLVAATPPAQIAASTRGESPASVTQKPDSPDAKGEKGQKVDIEKVASDVYRAVMQMMESARMRNGEPYL